MNSCALPDGQARERGTVAFRSYKVLLPVDAQGLAKGVINAYFKLKKRAPAAVFLRVKMSKGKAYLKFASEERKALHDALLKDRRFSKHYVDSVINSTLSLVKGWVALYSRGKAKTRPQMTRRTVYLEARSSLLEMTLLRVGITPRERYLEVDPVKYLWLLKDFDRSWRADPHGKD